MPVLAYAIIVRILLNPFSNVIQKKLTLCGMHPFWLNFVSFFLLGTVCIVPALSVDWDSFGKMFWLYCVVAGLFCVLGNGFLVRALQLGDLSVLGPINSYKSVVGMIVGIFALGEIPNIWGMLGVVIIIFGSYFVLDTVNEKFSCKLLLRKEIRYRFWALVLTAIEAIFIKKIIGLSNPQVAFIVWCWFGAVLSLPLLPILRVKPLVQLMQSNGKKLLLSVMLAATIGLTQWATNLVFDRMNVSYALALFQLSSIVSVLLGWRIFCEKNIVRKLLGGVIMIVGATLIILMN